MNAIIGFTALAADKVNQPDQVQECNHRLYRTDCNTQKTTKPKTGIPEQDFHLRPAPFSA